MLYLDSFTALSVSSAVYCVLFSFIALNGTVGLLSSCAVLEIELKVSKPAKAIPFLRFSTASAIVCAPSKYTCNI